MQRFKPIRAGLPRLTARSIVALAAAVAAVASLAVAAPRVAGAQEKQFPIDEPFTNGTTNNPLWKLDGSAKLKGEGDKPLGWLQLTSKDTHQMGTAILNDDYPSSYGIVVQFQYADFGGSSPGADGFSFFLIDGEEEPSVGASGAGLGYASNADHPPGIKGGYVGIGFDEYGYFSNSTQTDSVSGPVKDDVMLPQHIVVRGPTDQRWPYLAGELAPGGTVETKNDTIGVRTVRITIIDNPDGTPLLSVYSNTGQDTPLVPVITDLELTAPLPPTFKLGFSGGTGKFTNIHEIRNLTVGVPADVSVVKQCPGQVEPGAPFQCTLRLEGNGPSSLEDAEVHDVVPPQITDVTWTCVGSSGGVCEAATHTGNNITAPISFPSDHGVGNVTIVITGTVAPSTPIGMVIANKATVDLPADRILAGPSDNTSTAETVVAASAKPVTADLSIENTVDNSHPMLGEDVTFTVTVTNNGPGATTTTLVRDQLPAGLDYVSDDAAGHGETYEPFGGVWEVGPLAPGETRTLRITASAQNTVPVVNQVTYAFSNLRDPTPCEPPSPTAACGPAVKVSTGFARLETDKTATPATTAPGGRVTFHLSVTNAGDAPASGVVVTDKLPPEVSYVSDDSDGAYHPGTGDWDVGDLAVGERRALNITVIVHATTSNAIVQATSDLPDPDPCLTLPSLPPPQVTRPYGCPAVVTVTVPLPLVPVTG